MRDLIMKIPSIFLAASLSCLVSAALAEKPVNLAVSPALHPGTEAKHESFNEISKLGEARIVFLGDSITAGWSGKGKEVWEKTWAPMKAVNFGIGGDRTEHILWRLEHGNYDGLKPELTVLMIGTNNTGHQGRAMAEHGGVLYSSTAEQTAEGVTMIIDLLKKKQPQMKILLLAIFPRGADNDDKMRQQNEVTNQLIAKLADEKTVYFLDINKAFLEADGTLSKEIMPDLLHPNAAGYQIWTDAIQGKVKELLGE
jgi:lysophospholipase L1-like esterase